MFARHFIAAGAAAGEPGIIVVFEEHPGEYLVAASAFGPKLAPFIERGLVEVLYLRPLDLTVDEALAAMREAGRAQEGAKRVAIDSLSEFELALAPSFRDDFRESLFRTVSCAHRPRRHGAHDGRHRAVVHRVRPLPARHRVLADVLVLQRYVELEGKLEKVLAVVKMRDSATTRTSVATQSKRRASSSASRSTPTAAS